MGSAWEVLFKGLKLAEDEQLRLEREFSKKVAALMKRLPREFARNLHKRQQFPFLQQENKYLTNEQILSAALNMGNQGNLDALMIGWGVERQELDRIVATMPAEAWFENDGLSEFEVKEDSIRIDNGRLLTILSICDESIIDLMAA